MSRQKIVWTPEQYASVEYMAMIHCTEKEICGIMKVSDKTLCRLLKKKYGTQSFSEFFEMFSAGGKMSLRREQFKAAEKGNVTMLIWLGKQWLNQRDAFEQTITGNSTIEMVAKELFGDGKVAGQEEAADEQELA